ncbi:thymidylate synthase [Candidatus Saccharibacteria bacterium]|nr:thymidylate synthase [Candidatus Saccharibacteria bacterium]
MSPYKEKLIKADSVDELVKKGIKYIQESGERIWTTSGLALQSNNVTYVLENSFNRVHALREPVSIKYFARELFAYFVGSLKVNEGLSDASKFWNKIADENGMINSNYGYYVFRKQTPEGKSQLQWVRNNILENQDTRQAVININGIEHKRVTKDFPCTLGLVFHLDGGTLNLDVSSRSTDVITGLPYDIGFFSFVLELLAALLSQDLGKNINAGYTAMHAFFTQIYDRTKNKVPEILKNNLNNSLQQMPRITDAEATLEDIIKISERPPKTDIIKWVIKNKE